MTDIKSLHMTGGIDMVEKNTEKMETGSNSKMASKADSSVEMKKLSMKEPLWVSVSLVLCGGIY